MDQVTARPLGASLGVLDAGERLAELRYAELVAMETAAGWLLTLPPIELEIALSRFVYEDALHAEALGVRTGELRRRAGLALAPSPAFVDCVTAIAAAEDTVERLVGLFAVLKPWLVAAYERHLALIDPLLDAPTADLLRRLVAEEAAQVRWGQAAIAGLCADPDQARRACNWQRHLESLLARAEGARQGRDSVERERRPTVPQPIALQAPVRDGRFRFQPWQGSAGLPPLTHETIIEYVHYFINTELAAAEMCGRSLVEFPELPWELRLLLARQCWDEGRHAELFRRRLIELGGEPGMFPFDHWLYDQIGRWDDPLLRLMSLNRVLEGHALDSVTAMQLRLEALGDPVTAQIMEYIVADETIHTGIANWIERLLADDPPRRERLLARQREGERELYQRTRGERRVEPA